MLDDSTARIRPWSIAQPRCGAAAMVTRSGGVGPIADADSWCICGSALECVSRRIVRGRVEASNGTIVAATPRTWETASAISSAVRS
jgi:hypothetical protein